MSQANDIWAVIVAAGSGSRLASAGLDRPKQYLDAGGVPLFWRSARTLARIPRLRGLVLVFPAADLEAMQAQVAGLVAADGLGLAWKAVAGGPRRQDSVRLGLSALPRECGFVLVHDAARPFASAALVQRLLAALDSGERAVIPVCAVKDTVKRVEGGRVLQTLARSELALVQTPQAFARDLLEAAHARAGEDEATDDAALVEGLCPVAVVPGEEGNVKITTPEDLSLLRGETRTWPCVGYGYDVHRYGEGRPMVLGGVPIPGAPQIVAHSDGDVLLHALADAVLGCFGGGDIGLHFPDTDPAWSGVNSAVLLQEVLAKAQAAGVNLVQADLTIVAQVPKISPHREEIAANVAHLLGLERSRVNLKATTEEGLGFTGEKKGIKAVAVVTALRSVG
jgi:2-C-methyl-D-erythritol 4-phosphate cytidylyltransferase/2-C-methyl-D-erythritol 2,4-cyclodiphosphate synthase